MSDTQEKIKSSQISMAYSDQLARILADRGMSWDQLSNVKKSNIMRKYQEKFYSTAKHEGDHQAFPNENEINQFLNEENIGNKVESKGQEIVDVKNVNPLLSKKGGRRRKRKTSVPKRYVPKQLSKKDKKKQARELKKSRRAYKKGKYHTRKKMKSFKSKVSPHIIKARKMYKVDKIRPTRKLAKATKCKLKVLKRMFKKGQGAYFSSGSRPNQTGHSWGYARMASAITGGKASAVDFKIIQENCSKKSRAYKLAKKAYKKYKKGRRRVKQVQIGGRRMKESIVKFKRGPYPKKYTAIVKNKKNKKTRKIHFGDRRYQQYKDRTPLKLYKSKNHNTRKRMQNYFSRHSGTKKRGKAIKKEKNKSNGLYNAKILSHVYLW